MRRSKNTEDHLDPVSAADHLDATRAELVRAQAALQTIVEEEHASLSSDEAYSAWSRRKRLAENEEIRLRDLLETIERKIVHDQDEGVLADFDGRYNAAADRNNDVAALFREALPEAWQVISEILRAAALAAIETEAVQKAMPSGYRPKRALIDPDYTIRCRPAVQEEVLSQELAELWTDRKTGALFSDQSKPPVDSNAIKKRFKITSYMAFRPGGDAQPFWKGLIFPRLDTAGPALFDGTKARTPADVLRQLSQRRPSNTTPPVVLRRIEPI